MFLFLELIIILFYRAVSVLQHYHDDIDPTIRPKGTNAGKTHQINCTAYARIIICHTHALTGHDKIVDSYNQKVVELKGGDLQENKENPWKIVGEALERMTNLVEERNRIETLNQTTTV